MVLKKIGVGSAAKIIGALYASIGLLVGICLAVFSSVFGGLMASAQGGNMPGWAGMVFGVGGIIILPIFYGVLGFIGGAIWAALYNLFAGMVGGIELHLE